MTELIQEILIYIFLGIINIGIGYFFVWLKSWLKKHNVIKELKTNEELVKIAVKAVQEGFSQLDGDEKFAIAKSYVIESANSKGLKVNADDIDWLIDSAVKDFKHTFGDTWKEK